MTTRLLVAYALSAGIGLAALAWLWFGLLRPRLARLHRRRARLARRAALAGRPA